MTEPGTIIVCHCRHTELVPKGALDAICQGLKQAGIPYQAIDDFCGLAANKDERLKYWGQLQPLYMVGCYGRAITSLFNAGNAPLTNKGSVTFLNLHTQSPEQILSILTKAGISQATPPLMISQTSSWIPWFPVIDPDRCQNCKLCLNFCLFGVYALSTEGKVTVQQPSNCKTNCPACARVCPSQAIIFPKYTESPFNGDEVPDTPVDQSASSESIKALKEGNIYDLLRQRSQTRKRFSTEPNPKTNLLQDLHQQLGIPLEILTKLSPADLTRIQTKADISKQKGSAHD